MKSLHNLRQLCSSLHLRQEGTTRYIGWLLIIGVLLAPAGVTVLPLHAETHRFDFGRHSNPLGEPAQLFELATNKIAEIYGASYVINLYHKDTIRYLAVADDGPVQPPYEPVHLIHVTQEVLALLRGSLPSTITLHPALPTTGCKVLGHSTQLHQVLMNLCTNAIHAMQAQGGSLQVHLAETDLDDDMVARHGIPTGTYVCLSMCDTGCGMTPEVLECIFEPFFTTKGTDKGMGVGLPVVHSIIQRHGGAITVASAPGQGTTFQVFLPLLEAPSTSHATTTRAQAAFRESMLFVDDNDVELQVGEGVQ